MIVAVRGEDLANRTAQSAVIVIVVMVVRMTVCVIMVVIMRLLFLVSHRARLRGAKRATSSPR